ncbi:MAG TPA: ATP-dependent metallopeptidase FtsH/Yme1/Tma family protein, partial [Gaiellaceae bacterium]|nr:ATP-dependent metallopeptidase FtsH/Yme1/Tma family protein [Gaiellaceae bacterium]
MNRFFRSALFPLVVIVLLVWLASQTLIPHGKSAAKETFSDFITAAKQGQVSNVEFNPSKRSITYLNNQDKKATVHYPADQSIPQITDILQSRNVKYDSKGTGG